MSVIEFTKRPVRSRVTKQSLLLRSFRGISRRYLLQEKVGNPPPTLFCHYHRHFRVADSGRSERFE
jgi:hypothetical protein